VHRGHGSVVVPRDRLSTTTPTLADGSLRALPAKSPGKAGTCCLTVTDEPVSCIPPHIITQPGVQCLAPCQCFDPVSDLAPLMEGSCVSVRYIFCQTTLRQPGSRPGQIPSAMANRRNRDSSDLGIDPGTSSARTSARWRKSAWALDGPNAR
jgi:hypothetical protein